MLRYGPRGLGETMLDVVASLSALTDEMHGDVTMLANYAGVTPSLKTVREIARKTEEITAAALQIAGREGLYLRGMIAAFSLYTRILEGETVSFRDAVSVMQQVEMRPVPEGKFQQLSARVEEELGQRGYRGTVGARVRAFLQDTALPPDDVTQTAKKLLQKAKTASLARVLSLPPEDEIAQVYGVRNVFWSGFSEYKGNFRGELSFNLDKPWSHPTFASVLCHEGYPGHQAFYCHWDALYRAGKLPLEAAFYSTIGNPANPMFEGVPENALHFLGWDDPREETPDVSAEEKALFALGRDILDLQRMVQMQGCYLYHVAGLGRRETAETMLSHGLYTPLEVENTITFFTHPVEQYYYPAYYYGRYLVAEAYERTPKARRDDLFRLLYDRPHTNETLILEVGELLGEPFDPLDTW